MFVSKDDTEIKWYWGDKKLHSVKILTDGKPMDLKDLHESAAKILESKQDMCKDIAYLGASMTGGVDSSWGFLLGWLVRSMKSDQNWNIVHEEEMLTDDEITDHLIGVMEEGVKVLKENRGSIGKISTPNVRGPDVTELFGK